MAILPPGVSPGHKAIASAFCGRIKIALGSRTRCGSGRGTVGRRRRRRLPVGDRSRPSFAGRGDGEPRLARARFAAPGSTLSLFVRVVAQNGLRIVQALRHALILGVRFFWRTEKPNVVIA